MAFRTRISALLAVLAVSSGCPRPTAGNGGTATPIPRAPAREIHSDVDLDREGTALRMLDARNGMQATMPDGWVSVSSFLADDSGPPATGDLRARARLGPDPFCVIDIAVHPPTTDAAIQDLAKSGRELFYFASIDDEPHPVAQTRAIFTSTALPALPGISDVGYWLSMDKRVVRIEGRFPSSRLPECKPALDAIVTSLADWDGRRGKETQPGASANRLER